jgi:hypothetical protein
MDDHEIDRALRSSGTIEPDPAFVDRVMGAVRHAERELPPLALPLRRIAAGFAALLLALAGGVALLAWTASSSASAAAWNELARGGDLATARAAMWSLLALACCWLVAHASTRALDA